MKRLMFVVLMSGLIAQAVGADVRVPNIFSDGMIMQQGIDVPIWGKADAGETVTVTLADQRLTATADAKGDWRVNLKALAADNEAIEITIAGKNTITIKNALAGEVWLAAGQSNMAWSFGLGSPLKPGKDADLPNVRFFNGRHVNTDQPQWETDGGWVASSSDKDVLDQLSIVGFYFARELHLDRKVPIGIVDISWGGLAIDRFMSVESLSVNPKVKSGLLDKDVIDRAKKIEAMGGLPTARADLDGIMAAWTKARDSHSRLQINRGGGLKEPNPLIARQRPAAVFNCRINPIAGYGIRGAIWWQGEWNAADPLYYDEFTALIADWRKRWRVGDFPFLFVQLQREGKFSSPQIREAFLKALSVPNTGMAVSIDLKPNLHPVEKDVIGHRLKLNADAVAYGKKDVVYSGPIYSAMKVDQNRIILNFNHVGGGLKSLDGRPLSAFTIAGADNKFVPADATIKDDTVIVSSNTVAGPIAVRYGWENVPECNLANKEGLPASPFRTDGR